MCKKGINKPTPYIPDTAKNARKFETPIRCDPKAQVVKTPTQTEVTKDRSFSRPDPKLSEAKKNQTQLDIRSSEKVSFSNEP
ncbi:hypothetical protein EYC80_004748 [Monilinia laxa]|uniref:Uncharacterized protein n=1 Tax=Monilinia laxa TaxID=61186 RepID=A0A5N6KI16_MONLA|nr:hypothetical protein EYC80_004748 [Monilinia laxa]